MKGVASGKLVVSYLWVEAAVRSGFIPDTKGYEVKDEDSGGGWGPRKSRIDKENGDLPLLSRLIYT